MDKLLEQAGQILLQQGLSGLAILGLVYLVYMLRAENAAQRTSHRTELAERDKLIFQIQEERVTEARSGYEVIRSIQRNMDAILDALRGR